MGSQTRFGHPVQRSPSLWPRASSPAVDGQPHSATDPLSCPWPALCSSTAARASGGRLITPSGCSMSRRCWSPHSKETQLPAPCVPPTGVLPAPNSRPTVESAVQTPHASGDHFWKDIPSSFCIFPPFPALTSRPVSQSCCLSRFYKCLQPVTCSSGTCLGADTAPPGTPGRSTCPLHTGVPRSQLRTASSQGVLRPFPTSR